MKSLNKVNLVLTIILYFTAFSYGQNKINRAEKILNSIEVNDNWKASILSDTIIVLERKGYTNIGGRLVRRSSDSLQYKIYFVVREGIGLSKQFYNVDNFLQNINDSNANFDIYFRNYWEGQLPFCIPPTLVFNEFAIVIFDNLPNSFNAIKPDNTLIEIEKTLWQIINGVSTGGIVLTYDK